MPATAGMQFEHVRTERRGSTGRITLNRPAKYNALTLEMVRDVSAALAAWERDDEVGCVLLDGAGERGFCSGGDLRVLYESERAGDGRALAFWAEEYRLNATIAAYPKPIVAFMAGTVMGGGVGLSVHARHRIVTETTRLAMPETRIGLIPDVGGTWLLSRTPGEFGTYLALTGDRIAGADTISLGLADHFVPSYRTEALIADLLRSGANDDAALRAIVARFSAPLTSPSLAGQRGLIDRAFACDTVEEIVVALRADESPFARSTAERILANAPTCVKITLRALRDARSLPTLEDCLRLEYRLMCRLLHEPDFREGARAAIVEKDREPAWRPATLSDVSQRRVDEMFAENLSCAWQR